MREGYFKLAKGPLPCRGRGASSASSRVFSWTLVPPGAT